MILSRALIAAGVPESLADTWVAPVARACLRMGIDNTRRMAAFVGQCAHESRGFTRVEERLHYTNAGRLVEVYGSRVGGAAGAAKLLRNARGLANRVYAFRNGNLDEESGDGWRFRGRGLLQLTGRGNYMAAELALDEPYTEAPDMLLQPEHAALSAAWFFCSHGCNAMADRGDVEAITRAINGPKMLGLEDRKERTLAVLESLR